MNKRLIEIAYYIYENDALGYFEAENLMLYRFDMHPTNRLVRELFATLERMHRKGVKPKEYPNIWSDIYIFH